MGSPFAEILKDAPNDLKAFNRGIEKCVCVGWGAGDILNMFD